MKRAWLLLLLCTIILLSCSGSKHNDEAIVNRIDIPVRVYPAGVTITGEDGRELPSGDSVLVYDTSITSTWHVLEKSVITFQCNHTYIDSIQLYDAGGVTLKLYSDRADGRQLATIDDTTARNDGWITVSIGREVDALVLVAEPAGSDAHIAHIELWGRADNVAGILLHYRNVPTLDEASVNESVADIYPAQLKAGENSYAATVNITNPAMYRAVYVVYTGRGIYRPVSVMMKVNECDWLGGLTIPESAGQETIQRKQSCEINPLWLTSGSNILYFKGVTNEVSLQEVAVVGVKDTGYNEPRQGTDVLTDGNGMTGVPATGGAIVTYNRLMRMYGVLVHTGENACSIQVMCKGGAGISEGGMCTATNAGWYYIPLNKPVTCNEIVVTLANAACMIGEVAACASAAEGAHPAIVVSYPRNGEYFGRTAYIQGFVTPYATDDGAATLTIGGRQVSTGVSGGFTVAISKDMVGLSHQEDWESWQLPMEASYTMAAQAQVATRLYDASVTMKKANATLVLNAGYSPYTQDNGGGNTTETPGSDSGNDVPGSTGLTVTVSPDSAKSIYYQGVQIEIPEKAVDKDVTITVIPLDEQQIQNLTPGMHNVTTPAAGYRFLFNGKTHGSFKKPITISIPYDKHKLLSGSGEHEIRMFYYDDGMGVWKQMEASRVVTAKSADYILYSRNITSTQAGGYVVVESTHFTDFINATLTVPEHPEALQFNPNSIKDIKAGEPLAGMQLIQPPQSSNTGDARVRFPITLPKGRAGMQPQLELTYSQQGGNGPFGLGWGLQVSSISIDTKWGAARYDGTDIYTLDGSQLVPVDNAGNYRTRIEGGFAKIVKQENYWVVTQKNGVRYLYGQTDNARLQRGSKIGQWLLEWMIDTSGNCIHYTYYHDTGALGAGTPFVQVYLDTIYYTGYNQSNGPFTVQFIRDEGVRKDKQIDGRMGFLVYTRYRYKAIRVSYNGQRIWNYILSYTDGAFDKSLLAKAEVRAGNDSLLYAHDFEYYDEVGWGNEHLNLFGDAVEMENAKNVKDDIFIGDYDLGYIGGSKATTNQYQFSGNFSPGSSKKSLAVGAEVSISSTETTTKILFIDIDGDGLADQVYSKGGIKYRRNLMGEGINGFADEKPVNGLPNLGHDDSTSKTKGVGVNVIMAGKRYQKGDSEAKTKSYFSDVNGDGYVDFIDGCLVYYNYGYNEATQSLVFLPTVPEGIVPVSEEIHAPVSPVDEDEEAEGKYAFLEYYFRDNPVLAWRAPFNGKISISGEVTVLKPVPTSYTTADGVWVSIQKTGMPHSALPKIQGVERGSSTTMALDEIEVKSGEYLFFRVDSGKDGAYDEVQWNPSIRYKGYVPEAVDENNMYIYQYNLENDFYVYGGGEFEAPVTGKVTIKGGRIGKYAKTSDDIMVTIVKKRITQTIYINDDEATEDEPDIQILNQYQLPVDAQFIGYVAIPDMADEDVENRETRVYGDDTTVQSVTVTQTIFECTLQSDTPIDYRQVIWENDDGYRGPLLQYTDVDTGTGDDQLSEESIAYIKERIFSLPVVTRLFTVPTTYVDDAMQGATNPYVFEGWEVPRSGSYRITMTATNTGSTPYKDELVLCVKNRRHGEGFIADYIEKVVNDMQTGLVSGDTLQLQKELSLTEVDDMYFIVATVQPESLRFSLKVEYDVLSGNPWVDGDELWVEIPGIEYIVYKAINPNTDVSFAGGFRNWYYGRWNADEYMYKADAPETYNYEFMPMDSSYMRIDSEEAKNDPQGFAEKLSICSTMIPKYKEKTNDNLQQELEQESPPTTNPPLPVWRGMDDDSWIGPGVFATTRVAKKNIEEIVNNSDEGVIDEGFLTQIHTMLASSTGIVDMRGVSKMTKSYNSTHSLGGPGSSVTITTCKSYTKRQFFDINGDRYPDIITDYGLIYTGVNGAIKGWTMGIQGPVQKVSSTNYNFAISPGSNSSQVELVQNGSGKVKKVEPSFPSLSFTLATGDSKITVDYQDINGDGLPDKIENGYYIQYNTGYRLSAKCAFASYTSIQHIKNKNRSLSGSGGYSIDKSFISGGLSVLENNSEKMTIPLINDDDRSTLLDINGDGLPDRIVEYDDGLKIYVNMGDGFVEYNKKSIGSMDNTKGRSWTSSITLGVKFRILPIITIGTVIIDGGGSVTKDGNSTTSALRDINGDGLPDLVYQSNNKLYARCNRTGKTNMLKGIKNTIGGSIQLDYQRVGNTHAMPQSQWVLSTVTADDGTAAIDGDSASVHHYTTQYEYTGGVQDRKNREFLGFGMVVEKRADGSKVEKYFHNDSYYTKGLMQKEVIKDAGGHVYVQKDYTYAVRAIVPVKGLWLYEVQYPYVTDEKATYYEGKGGIGVIHQQHYQYDDYGNVTRYTDEGSSETPSDDVTAIIQYYFIPDAYIMDRPGQIVVQDAAGKPYRYRIGTYNSRGQLVKLRIKNSSGDFAITDIGYDAYGNITLVRQPANSKGQRYHLQYSYDSATHTYIENITDTLGYTSTAKYDVKFGVPLWTRAVSGASMQYQYDEFGRLVLLWGPYDVGGRPALAVEYGGAIVTAEGVSRPIGAITTNRSGGDYSGEALTVVRYADGLGRELQVKTSAAVAGQYGYTVSGAKRYDALGRVVAEGKPQFEPGASTGYTLTSMQYPTTYQYDCMGRKTHTTYPDGGEVIAGYGIRDGTLMECITDQNGNSKTLNRDTRGNIVAVTEEGGITTTYQYDVLNQLIAVVDADGNTTSIDYDSMGRRIAIDNPDTGKTEYAYDDSGNLIAKQTANLKKKSQWIRYGYHFHQLKMVDNPTGDDVYYEYGAPGAAYNAAGRVTKETVGTLIDQYRYGALGEVVKKTRTIEGKQYSITWKWDNFGRLRSIVYSNNVVIYYAYDTGGQVKQVFGYYNGMRMDCVNNIFYDEYGSRTTIAYANGVVSQYTYDELMHRLIRLKTSMGDSVYQNITYSYDKVGNIVSRSENGIVMSDNTVKNIMHHYEYDSLYRLTEAEGSIKENGNTVNRYTNKFTYSSIGNILQKLQTVTVAGQDDPNLTYSYNYSYAERRPHAVVSINDNLTYRYDANGNMTAVYDTAKQFNRILYWDDDNRLTKTVDTTSGTSVTTQYNYDAKGMRIVKDGPYGKSIYIDTGYVESGASQTTAPIVSNHIFVGNTRVASVVKHTEEKQPATYFYASDHLGSSSVLTTQQGSYHERIEYLPYGETWVEDKATSDGYSTPYKFTGKELDAETGLYYFGARYYDARMSRWVSADPALEKYIPKPNDFDTEHDFYWYIFNDASGKLPGMGGVFNSGNMNLYHYALNNPIKITDPDGKAAFFWHFMLTYSVARNLGIGFVDSIKLAWNAMIWDFRKGSQSKTDEAMINSHAMKSENQSIGEGRQGADAFITKKLNTAELKVMMDEDLRSNSKDTRLGKIHSALQDVGEATHCAVDKATNTHRDKKWSKDLTFNDKMKHFWGDIFLSDKELSDAKQNVKDVLTRALDMGVLRRNDEN